jgi:hypothetical protein
LINTTPVKISPPQAYEKEGRERERTVLLEQEVVFKFYLLPSITRESASSIPDATNDVDKQTERGIP